MVSAVLLPASSSPSTSLLPRRFRSVECLSSAVAPSCPRFHRSLRRFRPTPPNPSAQGEENEGEEEAEANAPKEEVPEVGFRKSSRSEQVDFKVREEERRRQAETQQDLLERVNAATLAAFNVGGDGAASGAGQGRKVSAITAYQSPREFASNGLMAVQVDHKAESVLVPIYGHLVPFHVLTIKNATVNQARARRRCGDEGSGGVEVRRGYAERQRSGSFAEEQR